MCQSQPRSRGSCKPIILIKEQKSSLQWRHNGSDGVENHQPHDCLLNRLIRRRSKKTSNLRVTAWPLCREFTGDRWIPRTKRPVTRKLFPFDDVIMTYYSDTRAEILIACKHRFTARGDGLQSENYTNTINLLNHASGSPRILGAAMAFL